MILNVDQPDQVTEHLSENEKVVRRIQGRVLRIYDDSAASFAYLDRSNRPIPYTAFLYHVLDGIPGQVDRALKCLNMCGIVNHMLKGKIVSLMSKVIREEGEPHKQGCLTTGGRVDLNIKVMRRLEEETKKELKPYVALLALLTYPEHF